MDFSIKEINNERIQRLKEKNIWREECPVHHSRLRIVEVKFVNFEEHESKGEMIVLDEVAEAVQSIFIELFELGFQIGKMIPLEEFGGDDVKSMGANNSSGFNGRKVARTDRWSSHSYGCAIDINPIQNPYLLLDNNLKLVEVIPPAGNKFLDRSNLRMGMVEEIVPVFAKYGFTDWGGNWEAKPDFHHFQIPWEEIYTLFNEYS